MPYALLLSGLVHSDFSQFSLLDQLEAEVNETISDSLTKARLGNYFSVVRKTIKEKRTSSNGSESL